MTARTALACIATALVGMVFHAASTAWAEPAFVGSDERHEPSVAITLHRSDLKRWAATGDDVQAYCFFHAANVAHVDGRWYAINGIALSGIQRHWIEDGGRREELQDEHKASAALRDFLYAINDKMNDACP